ncbi:hypothetical protein E0485_20160 [Paenibacillus albiflavus]|uniref:Uncharacterized protein n=1 Tax=Paenibacillus albiflavus TaxID=2545760 RepID=A0A4R4E932_9BACL|nr:hypothetical protein [Paenibacillus albiflavus]TCZ74295.1 hypothetical protein E0485_20160 [Paenibacillus albiflavus]
MINLFLASLGTVLGLLAIGGLVYGIWLIAMHRRTTADTSKMPFPSMLLRWTVLDYIIIVLFVLGLLLLFADLTAVLRDRASFSEWHLVYLVAGVIFSFMGMLMMVFRLFMLNNAIRSLGLLAPDHEREPDNRDHAE